MSDSPDPDPGQHLLQLSTGFILSIALQIAAELGIADQLAAGPKSTRDLAAGSGAHEDPLYRVLRLLASVGIFQETGPRRFALTPPAELLRRGVPGTLHDLVVFTADPLHFRVYANAIGTVRTGRPAMETTVGMPPFEYLSRNLEYAAVFNAAMTTLSAAIVPAVLDAYDFTDVRVLVDVAGGHGQVLASILHRYPHIRGVLVDRDHVIPGAMTRFDAEELSHRCRAIAGDFFEAVPSGGDVYLLKHIIHDWDDERALQILRSIHRAMGATHGRVILLESVLGPANAPDFGKIMDIEMLLMPGGRERTADEFRALFDRADFELTAIVPTKSSVSVIEARKR